MKPHTRLLISLIVMALSAILLFTPTHHRAALEHNRWSVDAALAAFGDQPAPDLPADPHPHTYHWLARLALLEQDPDSALTWLSALSQSQDPFNVDARAWALFEVGAYAEAIAIWQSLGDSRRLAGVVRELRDEGEQALSLQAQQAVFTIDPIGQTLRYASALRNAGQQEQAQAVLLDSLAAFPQAEQRVRWWRDLGNTYRRQEDWARAEAAFRSALEEDEQDHAAWIQLGWLAYDQRQDLEAAQAYFAEAIQAAPERHEGYSAMGQLFLCTEQPQQALDWFRQASEVASDNLRLLLRYANLLRDTGNYQAAIAAYQQAAAGWPDAWDVYFQWALAYQLDDNLDAAIAAIETAIDLNPDEIRVFLRAGTIYESAGRLEDALAAYQAALIINPDHREALAGLERLQGDG